MDISQILYHSIMYLNCIFEVYLLYDFLSPLFSLYEDRKWMVQLVALGCATAVFIVNYFKIPLINTLVVPPILALFIGLVFRIELKYNFLYVIFYYLIMAVSEVAFMYVYPFLGVQLGKADVKRIILLIIQDILRFIVIQIIKQMHHNPYEKDSHQYTKYLYILPVADMILLNGFIIPIRQPYGNILISLGCVLVIISSIVIFSVVENLLHSQKIIKDNEMLILKTNLEEHHLKRMEELNREYAAYIHDMNHIFRTIDHLAETGNNQQIKKLSMETAEFLKAKLPLDRKKYIGDLITDAIFSEREKIAVEIGIRFQMEILNGVDISFISDLDKIRIFGNLLDNAIEAAAACDHGYVSAELHQGNDAIVIFRIKNNFNHKNNKKGDRYLTVKDDGIRHGFGLENVKVLSTKYNGVLNILEERNVFTVTLLLSNVQKTEKS